MRRFFVRVIVSGNWRKEIKKKVWIIMLRYLMHAGIFCFFRNLFFNQVSMLCFFFIRFFWKAFQTKRFKAQCFQKRRLCSVLSKSTWQFLVWTVMQLPMETKLCFEWSKNGCRGPVKLLRDKQKNSEKVIFLETLSPVFWSPLNF